ncbi:MAG: hypothetical protein IKP58_08865 [Victivallales bacterium]|nr:hypothetical protein [Victivallales bacterium]
MILIPEQVLFVLGEGGQRESYDFAGLCADLRKAFERNGVRDAWLVDQFTLTVEERLRGESPMTESEIDGLLSSVLTATGYGDVAATFTEIRGEKPLDVLRAELHPWDETRIRDILRRQLPLSPRQQETLTERCSEVLEKLCFTAVSDTFVRELAIHLLYSDSTEKAERASKKTEAKHDWAALCDEKTRSYLERRVLVAYPVAPLFPRPRIAFNLTEYCRDSEEDWRSELALCAKLPDAAHCALRLLTVMRNDILTAHPDFTDCPGHVVIPHFQEFVDNFADGVPLRQRRGFGKRLRKALAANLAGHTDFEVMVSYR